jgi:hypothetical protein
VREKIQKKTKKVSKKPTDDARHRETTAIILNQTNSIWVFKVDQNALQQ